MSISVVCACGKRLRARDEMAGKRATCPGCGGIMQVPAAEPVLAADDIAVAPREVSVRPRPVARQSVTIEPVAKQAAAVVPPPSPFRAMPSSDRLVSMRHWLYFIFLLALMPLVIHSFSKQDADQFDRRLEDTLAHHPESTPDVQKALENVNGGEGALEDLFTALPGHRLEGAMFARDSLAHWLLAMLAGA